MALAETSKLIASLELKDKFTPTVKKANEGLGKLESGVSRASRGAGQMASGFAKAGTRIAAGIGVGLAGAAKAAIDWEEAFTGVQKTVDQSTLAKGTTFRDLELVLRQMATEMPNTASELAAIAEAGGAMGIAGKDIASFTKQVAILASTTNVSAEDAATSLGQLQNVIGLTGDEFDNFAASLVDLGNKGASTEATILEIARRSGGAARLFGVAKEETLGWAAAVANLGINEELAGTALQNLFVKLLPKYTQGAKDLVEITGKTAKQLKKSFKEDAGGAIEDLIVQLGKLPKDQRLAAVQDLFGKGSGLTRVVLGLADSYETNLAPALDTATESWEAATAAQVEFDKRNATVRSTLARLKNGINDAAITLGEGFTPAVGRAADKLAAFLKQDKNRKEIENLGKQIGDEIDKIDWAKVVDGAKDLVGVMKVALSYAKLLFDAFNSLPTQVKGATAAIIALDKLSGGLIIGGAGGIVGGLGESLAKSLAARIPVFGKAFVQPVFVTNMGAGLPGGGPPVPGAKPGLPGGIPGTLTDLVKGLLAGTIVVALQESSKEAARGFNEEFKRVGIITDFKGAMAGPQGIIPGLQNIAEVIRVAGELFNKPPKPTPATAGAFRVPPGGMIGDQPDRTDPKKREWRTQDFNKVVTAVEGAKAGIGADLSNHKTQTRSAIIESGIAAKNSTMEVKAQVASGTMIQQALLLAGMATTRITASGTQGAIRGVAPPIVGALRNMPRPITNVVVNVSATHVTKSTTIQQRYGPGNGSSGQQARDGNSDIP